MEKQKQHLVVAVRFSKVGKLYHFEADPAYEIKIGDQVVVETARGWQLGDVAQILGDIKDNSEMSWKRIDRKATMQDLQQRKNNELKEQELFEFCRDEIRRLNYDGVKAVSVEYSLDASKISVLYSYESENKIDLKNLKNELSKKVRDAQIELRQIGPRDVAKIFGGMGACGLPTRCCTKFLTDFSSISIRMAKEQGISLTPSEITGMCGRLRCCLIYEYETYAENRKQLPKRNKRVMTPVGEGKVVDVLPLKMAVIVDIPEVGRKEFFNSDLEILDGTQRIISDDSPKPKEEFIQPSDETKLEKSESDSNIDTSKGNRFSKPSDKGRRPKWRKRRPTNRTKDDE